MGRNRGARWFAWGWAGAFAGLGLILIGAGVVHLAAALQLLRGRQAVEILERGELPTPEGFERVLSSRRAALSWRDLPEAWVERATANLVLAQMTGPGAAERTFLLSTAAEQFERGLEHAPVDPHAWLRLTFVLVETGNSGRAAKALDLSLLTGPTVPELVLPRSALGLTLWSRLTPSARGRLARELARATKSDLDALMGHVRATGHVDEVLAALDRYPAARRALERGLADTAVQE